MELSSLIEKHYWNMKRAAGSDEDIVGEFVAELLSGSLHLPEGTDEARFNNWACGVISERTRKAKNRAMKEKFHPKFLHYTDTPTSPTTPGEISENQLWALCTTKEDEPRLSPQFQHRLAALKAVFLSLPLADQEFLKAYQKQKAKELVPRYGKTKEAVRKRNQRLKALIHSQLQMVLREPKEMSRF